MGEPLGDDADWWPCADRHHHLCTHVTYSAAEDALAGTGLLDTTALCPCVCHAGCPLSAQGSADGWPQHCDCAGTLLAGRMAAHRRQSGQAAGPVSFREAYRRGRPKRDGQRRATAAIRARGRAATREQAERIVDEEYTRQGLEVPTGAARELLVDTVLHPIGRVEGYALAARTVLQLGKGGLRLARWLHEHAVSGSPADEESDASGDEDTHEDEDGRDDCFRLWHGLDFSVPVTSTPEEKQALERFGENSWSLLNVARGSEVELRLDSGGSLQVWSDAPHDPVRYGTIPADLSRPLLPQVAQAGRAGQRAVCSAACIRTHERGRMLYVSLPDRHPSLPGTSTPAE